MDQSFPPQILPYQRVGQATGLLTEHGFSPTIFEEMSQLNNQYGAINLGQGFPDTDGPSELFDAAISAMHAGSNQYAPISGYPQLREAIAGHQRRFYHQHVDSEKQVLVTAGASEALSASIAALINPGDEVIIFEPYYDIYPAAVALAGGNVKTVPLLSPTFEPNIEQLEATFSERTALVIVNDPHNPTGAVFSSEVKKRIVELACQFDVVMIQDAVYEHLVFEDSFEPLFALPGAAAHQTGQGLLFAQCCRALTGRSCCRTESSRLLLRFAGEAVCRPTGHFTGRSAGSRTEDGATCGYVLYRGGCR